MGEPASRTSARLPKSFISRLPIADSSKYHYRSVYRKHVKPVFGDMTLSQVANDRDGVMDLLVVKMKHLSNTPRQQARHVIVGTVEEAVKAGKLSRHRLDGIELADTGRYSRKSFVFPTYEQVTFVADGGDQPGHQARRGRRGTVRVAHARLRSAHRRGASGVQGGLHRGRHRLAGGVAGVGGRHEAGTAQAPQGGRVPRRARALLAVGDGRGHARWSAHPREREAVPAVRHDLLPVHACCRGGRHR